jgi:hypothetical protein
MMQCRLDDEAEQIVKQFAADHDVSYAQAASHIISDWRATFDEQDLDEPEVPEPARHSSVATVVTSRRSLRRRGIG